MSSPVLPVHDVLVVDMQSSKRLHSHRPLTAIAIILACAIFSANSNIDIALIRPTLRDENAASILDSCGIEASVGTTSSSPSFCSDEHERAVNYCGPINAVRQRDDNQLEKFDERRPYSLLPAPISGGSLLPECGDLDAYLRAVKLGTRHWAEEADTGNETVPSTFAPHGCHAPTVPPSKESVCDTLDQYSTVVFAGDSLTRHMRQALDMSIRGNFTHGGIVSDSEEVRAVCVCDGQFSENSLCRPGRLVRDVPPVCPGSSFSFGKRQGRQLWWGEVTCDRPNYKGLLLVLQWGLHSKMNANLTNLEFLTPVFEHPRFKECMWRGKARVIWLAPTAQSTKLDERYPHQARLAVLDFEREIQAELGASGYGDELVTLDWWNLTKDSPTSDGLHSLTEVNLAKASQMLYLLDRWPFPEPRPKKNMSDEITLSRLETPSEGVQHAVVNSRQHAVVNSGSTQASWYCASDWEKLQNACAGGSGVECTQETRASDCQPDEGCMQIDCSLQQEEVVPSSSCAESDVGNFSCSWGPNRTQSCIELLSNRLPRPHSCPIRWLFLGDSTMKRLFFMSKLHDILIDKPLREKQMNCTRSIQKERCNLNEVFGLPYRKQWIPLPPEEFGGPVTGHGACNDCSGCYTDFLDCSIGNRSSCYDATYGGYASMEFAKDAEIQTEEYNTSQENIASRFDRVWNKRLDIWNNKPICVMSAGIHDIVVKDITTAAYQNNVQFLLKTFKNVCEHIIWLGNTAPLRDDTEYKQTVVSMCDFEVAVQRILTSSTSDDTISYVNVFNASESYFHKDRIHMGDDWYRSLGNDLFIPFVTVG